MTASYPSVSNPAAGALLATEVPSWSAETLGSTGTLYNSSYVFFMFVLHFLESLDET